MITDKPEEGRRELKEKGFSAMLTDVLAVRLSHQAGSLQEVLTHVCSAGLNVEYMYALTNNKEDGASIVCRISNGDEAARLLKSRDVELYSQDDILRIFQMPRLKEINSLQYALRPLVYRCFLMYRLSKKVCYNPHH